MILFWILGRLTGDFHAVLFLCEAIVLLPYILVVRKLYPRGYPIVGFFLCFVVFGYTLNIIRQCIATSMLVMMVYELFREKRGPAIVFLFLAVGFHKMSIHGTFLFGLFIFHASTAGANVRIRPLHFLHALALSFLLFV